MTTSLKRGSQNGNDGYHFWAERKVTYRSSHVRRKQWVGKIYDNQGGVERIKCYFKHKNNIIHSLSSQVNTNISPSVLYWEETIERLRVRDEKCCGCQLEWHLDIIAIWKQPSKALLFWALLRGSWPGHSMKGERRDCMSNYQQEVDAESQNLNQVANSRD